MTITPTTLFRAAGVAASVAGLIFIGVQINHPHLDATSITTTDLMARNFLKMLMAALALAGITGMYLRQVTKIGVLGLLGYVLFAVGFLSIFGTEFVAALVLPSIAHSSTAYVNDVIAAANNGTAKRAWCRSTKGCSLSRPAWPSSASAIPCGASSVRQPLRPSSTLSACSSTRSVPSDRPRHSTPHPTESVGRMGAIRAGRPDRGPGHSRFYAPFRTGWWSPVAAR